MKEKIKKILEFIKNNWFKLVIIIILIWLVWTLGHLTIYHKGWIENERPGILPSLRL